MKTTAPVIQVVPYDSQWPVSFKEEAGALARVLEGQAVEIHHIGSTAVPGLGAKNLIDVLIAVKALQHSDAYEQALTSLGYSHFPLTDPGRLLFIKGSPRSHHVHIAERHGWHYWRFLLFRDCLKSDPDVASAYEQLKRASAQLYPDNRDEYTLSKTEFITSTVMRLLQARPDIVAQLRKAGEALPEGL